MTLNSTSSEALFGKAIEIESPEERAAFLDQACVNDPDLRRELDKLVADHFRAGRFLEEPAAKIAATIDDPQLAECPGTVIGTYKLLQQIGEGGFGVVFMAEQLQPVRRKVALKVLKPGMDTRHVVARFEAERQALALMDHPNIAQVFDGGATTSGRPYFVMELVRGVPITDFCDQNQVSVRDRLELFTRVCQAVQHAHQKGIIHRDLKPSNVMVTLHDGVPVVKVIDFGIAKAMGQQLTDKTLFTNFAQMMGTPIYMSPEQAELSGLDMDTRSDIYSLGVLLYELLTGATPFDKERIRTATYDEIRRIIREEEPAKPSKRVSTLGETLTVVSARRKIEPKRLSQHLRGELDWIVMKALEKDRTRRYETASAFAADVERYLHDDPVQACPPSAWYRFRKYARRNKAVLATATVVALAVLLTAASLALSNARINAEVQEKAKALAIAKSNEKEAQENLRDALTAVDQMLTRVGEVRLPSLPQIEPVRRELLQDALVFFQKFLQDKGKDPALRRETAQAYRRLARIQFYLGHLAEAEAGYRQAFDLIDALATQSPSGPSDESDAITMHREFAWVLQDLGKFEEMEAEARGAVRLANRLAKEFPGVPSRRELLLAARGDLAEHIVWTRPNEAEQILRQILPDCDELETREYKGRAYWLLAFTVANQGRAAESLQFAGHALSEFEKCTTEDPQAHWLQQALADTLLQIADTVANTGQSEEAEKKYRWAIRIYEQLVIDHPAFPIYRFGLANAHRGFANLMSRLDPGESEKAYRRALDLFEKLTIDFPVLPAYPKTAFDQRLSLGGLLAAAGRIRETQQVYNLADAQLQQLAAQIHSGLNHWHGLVRSHLALGRLLTAADKSLEAQHAFEEVLVIQNRLELDFGDRNDLRPDLAQSHASAANLLRDVGRPRDAEQLYGRAIAQFRKLSAEHPKEPSYAQRLAWTTRYRAILLYGLGQTNEAGECTRQVLTIFERLMIDHPDDPIVREHVGHSYRHLAFHFELVGQGREAEQAYRDAAQAFEHLTTGFPALPAGWHYLADTYRRLGNLQVVLDETQKAEKAYRQAVALHERRADRFPNEFGYPGQTPHQWEWAMSYGDLARLLEASGRGQQAAETLRQAAANFAKLAEPKVDDGWEGWNGRGEVYAELGQWAEAKAALQNAVELAPGLGLPRYRYALVQLALSNIDTYRKTCAEMVQRFGQSPRSLAVHWTALACTVAPEAVTDWQPVIRMAENTAAASPNDFDKLSLLGAVLYRAERFEEAATRLTDAEAIFQAKPTSNSIVYNHLFQAMTQNRLGHAEEAKGFLDKAVRDIERPPMRASDSDVKWNRRLTLHLLRHEAELALGGERGQ